MVSARQRGSRLDGAAGKVSLPSRRTPRIMRPMSYAPGIAALNASALVGGLLLLIRP
jgi:hypothetical protein